MGRYGFTRVIAKVLVTVGVLILIAGVVGGAATAIRGTNLRGEPIGDLGGMLSPSAARLLMGTALFAVGLVVAAPWIVAGQLVGVFLDQRRLLIKQCRLLAALRSDLVRQRPERAEGPPPSRRRMIERL